MKSFMAAVRHFSFSFFAVVSVHIFLPSWHKGSVSTAWLCAPAAVQTGFHSIMSSWGWWGARGDLTLIVDFLLCSLPLPPTRAHCKCKQRHLAGGTVCLSVPGTEAHCDCNYNFQLVQRCQKSGRPWERCIPCTGPESAQPLQKLEIWSLLKVNCF